MDMYTLLHLKWITNKTYCVAHGAPPSVLRQSGQDGGLGENGYMNPLLSPLLFT